MQTLIQIARQSWVMMLGALAFVIGAGMVVYSMASGPPPRESLQKVEGQVIEASRTTRKSRRTGSTTSYYELTLKPSTGTGEYKLRVPTIEIGESDVRFLYARPVQAEFDSEQDVYVLSAGGREILTYKNSLERRHLKFRQYYVDGIAAMIGGAVALFIGFLLGYRKLRQEAAKAAAASS